MFRITKDPSSGSLVQYLAKITRMVLSCPLTWTYVNGHDRTILAILAKYRIRLPDDGCFVIRNMLEHFQIFYNFNYIYELYICAFVG